MKSLSENTYTPVMWHKLVPRYQIDLPQCGTAMKQKGGNVHAM